MPPPSELARIHHLVAAHNLTPALVALPPASALTIAPQTTVPSEYPHKLHIGTYTPSGSDPASASSPPQEVYFGLTITPRNGYGPSFRIFIGNDTYACTVLKDVSLLQPFCRLWEKTQYEEGTGSKQASGDLRRGVMKAFAYWYLLNKAEDRGEALIVPRTVRVYFVQGLRKVGDVAYGMDSRGQMDVRAGRKRRVMETEEEENDAGEVERDPRMRPGHVSVKHRREGASDREPLDTARLQPCLDTILHTPVPALTPEPSQVRRPPSPAIHLPSHPHQDEFKKLKEMMALDTQLSTEYSLQLAKTEALKEQLDKHREAIGMALLDEVAGAGGSG